MNIVKRISDRLFNKIWLFLFFRMEKIKKERQQSYINNLNFKRKGANSFFWGEGHFISGAENLELGENVHINANSFIKAEGGIVIGDNTHISRNLTMYSVNHNYNGSLLPYDNSFVYKNIDIGKNVWIGMNVSIAPGSVIGDGCIIGMGTTVSGNTPPLSIVGSPKCVILKQRDKEHYDDLDSNSLYGGINGHYYKWSGDKSLEKVGDTYFSRRSESELISFKSSLAVKKTFYQTREGKASYENELKAYHMFKGFNWCPQLLESGENYIVIEYFSSQYRLDKTTAELNHFVLGEVLWALLDIFNSGYAHCDINSKNLYLTEKGIKITDFETLAPQAGVNFFDSYDVTGQGLSSPFQTGNICLLKDSGFSLKTAFDIKDVSQLKILLDDKFKIQMREASASFNTRKDDQTRHYLQNIAVYSSFNLKHTKIAPEESQRDTLKRFAKFKITKKDIVDKTILDLGSNIGGTLLGLAFYSPTMMLGLEYDNSKVILANKLASYNDITNVHFVQNDVESPDSLSNIQEDFDVVFCLALIEHLVKKDELFKILGKLCRSKLYFEGNSTSDIQYIETRLKEEGFINVEYLGFSDDEKNTTNNVRPMFLASK